MQGIEPIQLQLGQWYSSRQKEEIQCCPICSETILKNRDDIRRPIGDVHLVQCISCGFVTYSPLPPNLMDYYSTFIRPQSVRFLQTKCNKISYHEKLLFEHLESTGCEFKSMLDYGCSDGYLMKMFLESSEPGGRQATGIELNKGHANWGRMVDGLDIISDTDLSKLGRFSIVTLFHVLEHVQNPRQFMEKIVDKIEKNGLLYIALPTISRIEYDSLENGVFKEDHINVFTDDLLEKFLHSFGLETVAENKEIYGTCFIMKKTGHKNEVSYLGDYEANNKVLEAVKKVFVIKDEAMSIIRKNPTVAINKIREGLDIYDNFLHLIRSGQSMMDPIDTALWYEEWIAKKPNLIELNLAYGVSCFQDKELDKARESLLKYKQAAGFSAVCNQYLAMTEYYSGNIDMAIKYLKESMKKAPYALDAIEMLGSMLTHY